ncbi:hypothetical protein PCASD_08787 [Puccinia coronata f. sp. avenae]|uniref:Nucleolar 27S pre-rRNA processing Urb2/Npa2 C-terminal domain-containing protein n=1 Tax=Puccinia coronata f. sp. avenae TaxID=200324 RepID=A0A2N5UPB4_9BASI|nr:hypothetical protein PCASD_08787 [Puccinia coronata f. sp. avenae]
MPGNLARPESGEKPADLFQKLKSREIPIEERIQLAQIHWTDQNFDLPYKQLYFLRWIFEVEFFEPHRSNKSGKVEPFNSPVHYPVFWKFLRQLVSDSIPASDLSTVLRGTPSILLLRHTLLEWSNLFEDVEFSQDVCSTLKIIFPVISQRLPLDLSLELLNQIFKGLMKLPRPTSESVEQIILLIINGVLPTIKLPSHSRKALSSIILDHQFLDLMLQAAFSSHVTSALKSLILQIIRSLAFDVESLKAVYLNEKSPIEWLQSLHSIGKKSHERAASVIEIVGHLVSELVCELPSLRSQLFSQHIASSAPQSSNSRTVAVDLAYLHATRTLILRVVNHSSQVLKELGSSQLSNLAASMSSHKMILQKIVHSNLYDPGQPTQHDILDQIANYCTLHLSNSSDVIAMDSLQILVDLLSLDYTLIEIRLSTILENLIVLPCGPNNSGPIREFLDGVFSWFSKAKQIPNLIDKWIEIIEAKFSQFSLRDISNGPLMNRMFIERAHEEIRLSLTSAQMAVMHDSLRSKFRSATQSSAFCEGDSHLEPSPKRRRISGTKASSTRKEGEPAEEADGTCGQNTELLALISNLYELFVTSASRSSLQSREWSNISMKISSFGGEIINTVLAPTLQRWPPSNSSKNRFRKLKNPSEQALLASTFRILASVAQVQGLNTSSELDTLELSEWLELLQQVSGRKKNSLNPELSFELIHLCLEFTSQRLSCLKDVDPTIPRAAYQTIFNLVEECSNLGDCSWNGSVLSLTSAELPLATWHCLTTRYLSEFATSATLEQINQFAQIAIKFDSLPHSPQAPDATRGELFSFLGVNRMVLRSPLLLECTTLRDPLLGKLLAAFETIMPLDDDTAVSQIDASQMHSVDDLYDVVSYMPLSYLNKWFRKRLFNWSFLWNEALLSQQIASPCKPSHSLCLFRSRVFLCRILSDPLSPANPEMMKQAVATTIKIFASFDKEEDQDLLIKVTECMISEIITKLMKDMKSGETSESSFELLDQLCKALSQRIKHAAKAIIKSKSIQTENRLIISPLQSIADYGRNNILDSNQEANGEKSAFIQRFQQLIRPVLVNLESALKKSRAKASSNPSNLGLLELGKIHLQLCRIDDKLFTFKDSLIDLKALLPSIDQIEEYRLGMKVSDAHPQSEEILPECLDLFEEMIQIHRHRYGMEPRDCIHAFLTLIISHAHLRIISAEDEEDDFLVKLRNSLIRSCKKAHPNESREALRMILNEINDCSRRFTGSNLAQPCELGSHLFNRFRTLIDVAVVLVMNYSCHDTNDTNLEHQSANNGLEEVVLKLLKSLKVCDLDNKQGTINPQQVNNFYVWKTDLLDQLCTAEALRIGRSSLPEVLETLIGLSTRKEFQTVQLLHDKLVSITSHLNQESLKRSLVNQFPILVRLLSQLMVPTLDMKNYSRLMTDLTSTNRLIAPFSKHAPFLVVDLVSKISITRSSSSVEAFVNHGLFSLISTMGKFERNSIGHRILESQHFIPAADEDYHLHADDQSNTLLNWKKILKNWEAFRYKGTD